MGLIQKLLLSISDSLSEDFSAIPQDRSLLFGKKVPYYSGKLKEKGLRKLYRKPIKKRLSISVIYCHSWE